MIGFFIFFLSFIQAQPPPPACWLQQTIRGVGTPLHTCEEGFEKSGYFIFLLILIYSLLCYPRCKTGERRLGPLCVYYKLFVFTENLEMEQKYLHGDLVARYHVLHLRNDKDYFVTKNVKLVFMEVCIHIRKFNIF